MQYERCLDGRGLETLELAMYEQYQTELILGTALYNAEAYIIVTLTMQIFFWRNDILYVGK